MGELSSSLKQEVTEVLHHTITRKHEEQKREIAELMEDMAAVIRTRAGGNEQKPKAHTDTALTEYDEKDTMQIDTTNTKNSTSDSPRVDRKYSLDLYHRSLHTMWHEWFGLGDYRGKPIEGGIERAEETLKNKWRKHFSAAETKQFSRTKAVIQGILTKMDTENKEAVQAIDELEEVYISKAVNKKLSTMVETLKSMGLIGKQKARGKSAKSTAG